MEPIKEIWKSVFAWKIWLAIGIEDVIGKYRRTMLGPLWIVFGQCAFIFGIFLVHKSVLGGNDQNFLLFLSISLPVWTMLSMFLTEGCNSFVRSKGYIESYPLPLAVYVIRTVVSSFVTFLHMVPIFFVLLVVQRAPISFEAILSIPALALLVVFGLGSGLILASITSRFRDIGAAITAAMQLMFVVSPVFWEPTAEQHSSMVVRLNPFYYLLDIIRAPLLNQPVSGEVWGIAVLITLVTLLLGVIAYRAMRPTVVYWL